MEGGLPMLNCLLQQTLRSLCSSDWVYAVFWRILPRNYPPPKWDSEWVLDRSKGSKRNWILVWDDGFCDFLRGERAGCGKLNEKFGADVFYKMSHEVYNYGEGLMGRVAADNSHRWIFKDKPNENDANFFSSWNATVDPHPRQWKSQFSSGIQTIAIVAVREGLIQLGSLDEVVEDLNLVISIQRKFNYLQRIPGFFAMQRPCMFLPEHGTPLKFNYQMKDIAGLDIDDKQRERTTPQLLHGKRSFTETQHQTPKKSKNLGWNSHQMNGVCWSIPPVLPSMSYSLGALLSKLPSVIPQDPHESPNPSGNNSSLESKFMRSGLGSVPTLLCPGTMNMAEGKPET